MANKEMRYQFPAYFDQVGPYQRFLNDNHINPADVPWGTRFLIRDDNEIVIEIFDRDENGYREVRGDGFARHVESYHMVHHPDEYGIRPSGDGSVGVTV